MIVTRSDYATGLGKGMPTKEAGRSKRQKRERRCSNVAVFTYAGSFPSRLRLATLPPGGRLR